ncbi:hypothetical protein FAES_2702 [Fibrella aestuarina BUZ 2]|uniref:Uncharacterized protein n=1 Tax=Fibrella aestuarina BUZ 2 TaxID=1166018 RepID=I0K9A8_9BACT|nr:hypothetical protein FAES_2702 [Fibrella aestuarina BUZ 2]
MRPSFHPIVYKALHWLFMGVVAWLILFGRLAAA